MGFMIFYLSEEKKFEVFVDMDGVLTNFKKAYAKYSDIDMDEAERRYTSSSEKFWEPVNDAKVKFWSEMEWMPDGKELWNYIKSYNPTILTSPSRGDDCPKGKTIWVKRELGDDTPVIIERDKYKYSGENKILIDDTEKKITDWIDKGGIGILHTSAEDTIKQLKEIIGK